MAASELMEAIPTKTALTNLARQVAGCRATQCASGQTFCGRPRIEHLPTTRGASSPSEYLH